MPRVASPSGRGRTARPAPWAQSCACTSRLLLRWATHALAPLSFRAASYSGVFTLLPLLTGEGHAHHGQILAEATRLAEAGQLVPSLDSRQFTLDMVDDAFRVLTEGPARGKVAVQL